MKTMAWSVAGAGREKQQLSLAKVKYLVEKQHIDPSQILMISFTNKAVNELRERINRDLNIPCPIATFHSAGNAILHKNDPQNFNIVDSNKLFFCIQRYLKDKILREPVMVKKLVLFFASYLMRLMKVMILMIFLTMWHMQIMRLCEVNLKIFGQK